MFHSRLFFFLLLLFGISDLHAAAIKLPQSGQKNSYHTQDDGNLQKGAPWPTPRIVNNGDGTITDHLTGLMWVRDASCADTSNQIPGSSSKNWDDAFAFVEQLNTINSGVVCEEYTAEYRDWHVPNVVELMSLMPYGLNSSQSYFDGLLAPETTSSGFINLGIIYTPAWTSTTAANDNNQAWVVDFIKGNSYLVNKQQDTDVFHLFSAVRIADTALIAKSGQSISFQTNDDGGLGIGKKANEPRFVQNDDGTIIDRLSGLRWIDTSSCMQNLNWQSAMDYIANQNRQIGPFSQCLNAEINITTWRMPNIVELQSLIDYGANDGALAIDEFINFPSSGTIFSSTGAKDDGNNKAWGIDIATGQTIPDLDKGLSTSRVLVVSGPASYGDIETSPEKLQFGSYFVHDETAETITLEIFNTGAGELNIDLISIDSAIANEFSPGRDQCSNVRVSPDKSCTIEINFSPKKSGKRSATLMIPSNALGTEVYSIAITGTGMDSSAAGNSACFIATATFGTEHQSEINVLRKFRDDYLITNRLGLYLVDTYYQNSPPIADYIRNHPWAKHAILPFLLAIISIVKYPLGYLFAAMMLALLIVLSRRRSYANKATRNSLSI